LKPIPTYCLRITATKNEGSEKKQERERRDRVVVAAVLAQRGPLMPNQDAEKMIASSVEVINSCTVTPTAEASMSVTACPPAGLAEVETDR